MLLNKINYFISPTEIAISTHRNKVYLDNFSGLGKVTTEEVMVKHKEGFILLRGERLTLKRLSKDSMLVEGVVKKIEYRW